jgi:hypothetical protein
MGASKPTTYSGDAFTNPMFPWFQPSKKIPNPAMKLTQKVSCEPVIPSQTFRAMMDSSVDCEVTEEIILFWLLEDETGVSATHSDIESGGGSTPDLIPPKEDMHLVYCHVQAEKLRIPSVG